ncbi:MAG: hypothetical protein D6690_18045 [Nitrospirae bacterium]|nr:MAG: hypothetical protein D6690_18045 [Nitrospirota bacterium]
MDKELQQFLEQFRVDPEEEQKTQELYNRIQQISRGSPETPDAPSDRELLVLISRLFSMEGSTPFSKQYDPLIERLSFTNQDLNALDADGLKTAWRSFLKENEWDSFIAPEHLGMAEWYESHSMTSHAIAVYEYLYLRSFVEMNDDMPRDFCDISTLLMLCKERKLLHRARYFCEVIEDLYLADKIVSLEDYADAVLIKKVVNSYAILETLDSDKRSITDRLNLEKGKLLHVLHPRTQSLVIDATVWSSEPWRKLEPATAILYWAKAIEAEFRFKVYEPNQRHINQYQTFEGPPKGKNCTLGQISKLLYPSSNLGLKTVFARLQDAAWIISQEARNPLETLQKHRNQSAHAGSSSYTPRESQRCLREIYESGWIWRFLQALQPAIPRGLK